MKPLWIIESGIGASCNIGEYIAGVRASGAAVYEAHVMPGSGDLPDVAHDGPVVVFGSAPFVAAAQAARRWQPGVFASPSVFSYENWARHYGSLLLNSPDVVRLTTVRQFVDDVRPDDEDIFVRPQHDTRAIPGGVRRAGEFRDWCRRVNAGGYPGVGGDTPIVVGQPFGIEAEWRLFIVDGEIVGASQYRRRHQLFKVTGAPEEIVAFARMAIARWTPADAYVLDVCLSGDTPFIIEAQSINSAGHYAADVTAIASAVNTMVERKWFASLAATGHPGVLISLTQHAALKVLGRLENLA